MHFDNANITDVKFIYEIDPQGGRDFIIQVETSLQLNPQHPAFDFDAIVAVEKSAHKYAANNNRQFVRFLIVSIAPNQATYQGLGGAVPEPD